MSKILIIAGVLALSFLSVPATGRAGEYSSLYFACASCHGKNGEGNRAKNSPPLAGLDTEYIKRQMLNYKYDRRGLSPKDRYGKQMALIAKAYSDEQIDQLATQIGSFDKVSRQDFSETAQKILVSADLDNGKVQYQLCASCHGANAEGNLVMQSPRLDIFYAPYLIRQLQHYRDGLRGYHEDDELGQNMAAFMQSEAGKAENINDIIAYILSLEIK